MQWTFWVLTLFPKVWVLESLTMPLWNGASTHTQRFLHLLTYSSRWTSYNALLPKHTHPVLGPSQRTKHDSFSVSSCLFNFIMGSLRRFVMYTTGNSSCAPGALPLGSWAFYSPAVWRALLLWGTALSDKRWSTVIISITSWDILESLLVRRLEVADQFTSPSSATGRMKGRLCSVLTHSCLTSLCHSFLSGCDPVGIFWLNVGVCDPVQGPVSMWVCEVWLSRTKCETAKNQWKIRHEIQQKYFWKGLPMLQPMTSLQLWVWACHLCYVLHMLHRCPVSCNAAWHMLGLVWAYCILWTSVSYYMYKSLCFYRNERFI